ncbi:MAG: 3-dehydroquinate synthase [Victivallales bacterium]|nr:3-dehydroquinate synthase [Victivallales bacterium]
MQGDEKIEVSLPGGNHYRIILGSGVLDEIPSLTASMLDRKNVLIITDDNVNALYGEKALKSLQPLAANTSLISIKPGEASKTLATVEMLYHEALKSNLDRSSAIIALGGGVVGDIAGFVAATFMRGIDLIQIPTTLLAMVDSSVGGKTGVDLPEGKNLVGAFWQPRKVLIDPDALKTLPDREIRCGLAETIKYGMVLDEVFFAFLEDKISELNSLDILTYTEVIKRCCQIKADVVCRDEKEKSGLRSALNYGHTFAHAIEKATGYDKLNHGEAVAVGMCMAANLAVDDGRLDDAAELRQENLLRQLHLPCSVEFLTPEHIYDAMGKDKKIIEGKLRFVLPETIGEFSLSEVSDKDMILDAIRNCCD